MATLASQRFVLRTSERQDFRRHAIRADPTTGWHGRWHDRWNDERGFHAGDEGLSRRRIDLRAGGRPRDGRLFGATRADRGQAPGAPLPVGLYFIDTSSFGSRDIAPRGTDSNINLPSFIWATPADIVGGRLQFVVLQPITASSTRGAAYQSGFGRRCLPPRSPGSSATTSISATCSARTSRANARSSSRIRSLHQRFAITYNGDGWNLTGKRPLRHLLRHAVGHRHVLPGLPQPRPHGHEAFRQNGGRAGGLRIDRPADRRPRLRPPRSGLRRRPRRIQFRAGEPAKHTSRGT